MNKPHCHQKNVTCLTKNSQMTINNTLQDQLLEDVQQNCWC